MMRKILVLRGGAIGDFILVLPVLEAIRARQPEAEVEVLGYPSIADLAVRRRYATAARRVDAAEWAPLFARGGELGEDECAWLLDFDCVFCIWPDDEGVIRDALVRAGVREVVYVDPRPPAGNTAHVVDFMAEQCERAGWTVKYRQPQVFPSRHDRRWAERYMRVTCAGERPLLALHPGSGSRPKNWPAENYAALARQWVRRRPGHVLVTIGPADAAALAVFEGVGEEGVFVLRDEALPRVAACFERCEAYVGNDSGMTHMAAAVRTPTLALFGPTDPRLWRPLARQAATMTPEAGENLAQVSPERVFGSLEGLLRRG